MNINRTSIITGPCSITYGGQTFWSKGDVVLKPIIATADIRTSAHGLVSKRITSRSFEVSFEPDGRFTTGLAGVLWPYASYANGASIFGAADRPLVITGTSGAAVTLVNAAITEMPALRIGAAVTISGSCKFTAILKNSADPNTAASYFTTATGTYSDAGFDPALILSSAASATWGTLAEFLSEGGWEFQFKPEISPLMVDGLGIVDMTLTGLTATAKATPVGPSMEDILAAMGYEQEIGTGLEAVADDLAVSGTGIAVTLNNSVITDTDAGWGTTRKRLGPTTWTAIRGSGSGTIAPLWTIGTGA